MKLTRLLPFVTAATLLLPAGVAQAQDDPQVVGVTPVVSCGKVVVNFDNRDVGAYVWGWATGPFDVAGEVGATGTFQVPKGRATRVVELPEDSFNGRGFVTLSVVAGPNTPRQTFRDLGLVDTDCAPAPPATTTPAPPPTTTTTTTTTPSVPPTAPVDDVDCTDVPQARAQEILDADRSDPNKLDGDGDGTACELDEAEPTPVVIDDASFGQVGEIPVGSVDTGRA